MVSSFAKVAELQASLIRLWNWNNYLREGFILKRHIIAFYFLFDLFLHLISDTLTSPHPARFSCSRQCCVNSDLWKGEALHQLLGLMGKPNPGILLWDFGASTCNVAPPGSSKLLTLQHIRRGVKGPPKYSGVLQPIQHFNVSEAAVDRRTEPIYERTWSIGQKWCPEAFFTHSLFVRHFWASVLRLADVKPIVPGHFLKKLHKQRESQDKTMSSMSLLSSYGTKSTRLLTTGMQPAASLRTCRGAPIEILLAINWPSRFQKYTKIDILPSHIRKISFLMFK